MCGINGILNLNDISRSKELIGKMNDRLAHRGPNDSGIFAGDGIALGHRRLSIIDLSSAGHQPMTSNDGRYRIIYNGELYNFKELKFDLQRAESGSNASAYLFKTNTDTEVILAAFVRWGSDCVKRFNGMFAFAIWDEQDKKIFIARDRLGIKPLYYYKKDDLLVFSSELRALLSSGLIKKELDENALCDYLRYQTVHAPSTIIKGVKMLLPGHYILAAKKNDPSSESFSVKRFWSLNDNIDGNISKLPYTKICSDINELFHAAVERRLVADVPFGAFLSGGIDSSAVVSAMAKVSTTKVNTFSVSFDENEFSEARYAKLIADKFKTHHHEIKLDPLEFLNELPDALSAMDHPSGDGPNTFVVSKATKNAGITMALSGLGGDELFAGYDVFKQMKQLKNKKWLNTLPGFAKKAGGKLLRTAKPGPASEKKSALLELDKISFENAYPLTRQVLIDDRIKKILKNGTLPANAVSSIIKREDRFADTKDYLLSRVSVAEISTYMQNVLLRDTDQMSMAHALEVRVPFMDHKLVEYVLSVPDKYKFPTTPKKLLTDSLGDALPREIIDRPKMGFTFPWKDWMKKELRSFCEEKMNALSQRSFFIEAEVKKLWNDFLSDSPVVTWSRVWYLIVLEDWLQKNEINE